MAMAVGVNVCRGVEMKVLEVVAIKKLQKLVGWVVRMDRRVTLSDGRNGV